MAKVQNFSGISPDLPFTEYGFYDLYRKTFENNELGRIKQKLPLQEMAESFGPTSKSMRPRRGRRSYFTPEGKVALMFLKMYPGPSGPKLMEQLNGNIHHQLFCDVRIGPLHPLTNCKLPDDEMSEMTHKLKIRQQQDILARAWKPYMKGLETMCTDATCYESEMRYPTDPKLPWEGTEKAYGIMCELSEKLNVRRPRTKYLDVEKANLAYRKRRRRTKVQTRKITRRLLLLLEKILKEIRRMEREHAETADMLTARQKSDIEIITRMYRQQKKHFDRNDPRKSVKDRIVSISKPYVRPIVRGKDAKGPDCRTA